MSTKQIIPGSNEGECDDYNQARLHVQLAVKATGMPHCVVLRGGKYYVTRRARRYKVVAAAWPHCGKGHDSVALHEYAK